MVVELTVSWVERAKWPISVIATRTTHISNTTPTMRRVLHSTLLGSALGAGAGAGAACAVHVHVVRKDGEPAWPAVGWGSAPAAEDKPWRGTAYDSKPAVSPLGVLRALVRPRVAHADSGAEAPQDSGLHARIVQGLEPTVAARGAWRADVDVVVPNSLDLPPAADLGKHLTGIETSEARVLSEHPTSGARTALVSLEGTASAAAARFSADTEIFVVEGELKVGRATLGKHCYAFVPEGVLLPGAISASPGTKVLMLQSSGAGTLEAATEHAEGAKLQDYVPKIDATFIPWTATLTPGYPTGAMRKTLRAHPTSGTWLIGCLPHFGDDSRKSHPCDEEVFVLGGSLDAKGMCTMETMAYRYTPAHVTYGPNKVPNGTLLFVHHNGPFKTYMSTIP